MLAQLSGGADLSKGVSPDDVEASLGRLESMHQQGAVNQEQYEALKAALESMLAQS